MEPYFFTTHGKITTLKKESIYVIGLGQKDRELYLFTLPPPSLGIYHILAPIAELFGQLVEYVLKYDRIDVLPEQIYEEPVADDRLLHDDVDALVLYPPIPHFEQVRSESRAEADEDSVNDHDERHPAENEHPEPGKSDNQKLGMVKNSNLEIDEIWSIHKFTRGRCRSSR